MNSEATPKGLDEFKQWLTHELREERQQILRALESQHDVFVANVEQKLFATQGPFLEGVFSQRTFCRDPTEKPADLSELVREPTDGFCITNGYYEEDSDEQSGRLQKAIEFATNASPRQEHGEQLGQHMAIKGEGKAHTCTAVPVAAASAPAHRSRGIWLIQTYLKDACNSMSRGRWQFSFRVDSASFELSFGLVILINTAFVAFEMEYNGVDIGHDLGCPKFRNTGKELYPSFQDVFRAANWFCNILFTIELALRLYAHRCRALRCLWTWLDLVVVPVSWLELGRLVSFDTSIIRIMRLARTVRVVKLIRTMESFRVLYLLIRSLIAGMEALVWTFAVIISIQTVSALFVGQMLTDYMLDESQHLVDRKEVFELFGTFSHAMLTMFEITDANWIKPTRVLVDKVDPWWGCCCLVYRCMIFFAFGKVIAAIFIAETNRLVDRDRDLQLIKSQAKAKDYMRDIWDMFQALDVDGDGMLTKTELREISRRPEIVALAQHMDLDIHHLEDMFSLLEGPDGQIHVDHFVKLLPRLKGSATSLEMSALMVKLDKITRHLDRVLEAPPVKTRRCKDALLEEDKEEEEEEEEQAAKFKL